MFVLKKGNLRISVDAWLESHDLATTVTAEKYVTMYHAELQQDGWQIVREWERASASTLG